MLYRYILSVAALALVWIANGKWLGEAVRQRVTSEIYMHLGLGLFFTLLVAEGILDPLGALQLSVLWVRVTGYALYLPAAYLVLASHQALKKVNPEAADLTATTVFVDTGVYELVRQPMTLGMFLWTIGLMLVFQSAFSVILGIPSLLCFWMSATKESGYNISKFGDAYEAYMKRVPMWNPLKRLRP